MLETKKIVKCKFGYFLFFMNFITKYYSSTGSCSSTTISSSGVLVVTSGVLVGSSATGSFGAFTLGVVSATTGSLGVVSAFGVSLLPPSLVPPETLSPSSASSNLILEAAPT